MTDKPFPKNPYVIGVPLTGDVGFYGRRGVFTFVEDTLNTEQQNVIVLYGQRRVGKTSLLHQLVKQLTSEIVAVYFDLQGRAQQSLGQVLYDLARIVARALKMSVPEQDRFDNAGRFFREEFLPSVYQLLDKRRLLLLFDEFDVLGDELASQEAASETLFPYLQNLIMHEHQIVFIFVVGRRIEELATHFQAIFKQAVYRRVGLLKVEDARTLIVEPVKEVLTFEEGAIESILHLTASHPYFTQLICSELFNAMKANNQHIVTEVDVLKLVNQAIESGHGALTWFWDGLPRAERFIMSAVAHVTDETGLASKEAIRQILEKHRIILTGLELTDAPDKLAEWEMLRREGPDNYRFVVELVRRWIIKMHPLESARRDVDFISQRAVRLYENAREAHSTGDLEYARDEYRRTLAANPNHSGAQLGLAQVLLELGQIEAAIEEFMKAYALDEISGRDGLVQAHLAQGKKLEEANHPNEAVLQYEQALKIAPTYETTRQRLAAIWLGRGHTSLATGDLTAAIEPYQKALDFDGSEMAAQEIKLRLEEHAQQSEAKQIYEQAFQSIHLLRTLLPQNDIGLALEIALCTRRGDALAKAGEETKAIEAFQRALELRPGDPILTQKLEGVSLEWKKLLETDHLFNQMITAHRAEDWSTAKKGWQQLIRMDVLSYKEYNIAALLSEAVELEKQNNSAVVDLQKQSVKQNQKRSKIEKKTEGTPTHLLGKKTVKWWATVAGIVVIGLILGLVGVSAVLGLIIANIAENSIASQELSTALNSAVPGEYTLTEQDLEHVVQLNFGGMLQGVDISLHEPDSISLSSRILGQNITIETSLEEVENVPHIQLLKPSFLLMNGIVSDRINRLLDSIYSTSSVQVKSISITGSKVKWVYVKR